MRNPWKLSWPITGCMIWIAKRIDYKETVLAKFIFTGKWY